MKKKEKYCIGIILMVSLALLIWQRGDRAQGEKVEIVVAGELYGVYSLKEDRQITIYDTNTLEIRQGKVRMLEADCPDHLCIRQGWINRQKETIICLPHRIVVTVTGGEEVFDAVVQ